MLSHLGGRDMRESTEKVHLLAPSKPDIQSQESQSCSTNHPPQSAGFITDIWLESKKMWLIAGPSIFSRVAMFSLTVVTQSFAGHLGDLNLAAISIVCTIIIGISFGFLLGMASALEMLCGQAYGAKQYHMLGIYMQRSWIVLTICSVMLLPLFLFAAPILELMGQPADVAELTGLVALWLIPFHLSFPFQFSLHRFLQCQLKTGVIVWVSGGALLLHVLVSWFFVYKMRVGIVGTAITLDFSWWITVLAMFLYCTCGGCPECWTGFSAQAFVGLWDFFKLAVASGVMLTLENFYYRVLIIVSGYMQNVKVAVDALSICITIYSWESMIPLGYLAAAGVLSAIFTLSTPVVTMVKNLASVLAFTFMFNSIQPVLSGVAVGSGWQGVVTFVNLGSYYIVGVPLGVLLGWVLQFGVRGLWGGMLVGTVVQTMVLTVITMKYQWEKESEKAQSRQT